FYDINFLHDWFYVSGFDEASKNAQASNYGRAGLGGDNIKAQAEDFQSRNNANMLTPADGARPRMRMYVFDGPGPDNRLIIHAPGAIAGDYRNVGFAAGFGANPTWTVGPLDLVWADDGSTVPFPGAPAGTV